MSILLAACGSSSGTSSDASVSGAISRGDTTGTGATSGSTSGGSTTTVGSTTGGTTTGGSTSGGTTGTTGGGTTTGTLAGGSLAQAPPTVEKSIAGWVSCDGTTDDTEGVARAFAAARHSAFTLMVDCPVRLHIGVDVARTVFIDSGTNVTFTGAGKFTVDNVFHPAFAIANSNDIVLTNWNVEYDASLPVNWRTGNFQNAGQLVASTANAPPAEAFAYTSMTKWLAANRAVNFKAVQGDVSSIWVGPSNTSAVFFVTGDTFNVTVTGMRLYAPPAAGADRFVPMAFSLSANFKGNQTVTSATPQTSQYVAIPHNLTFSDMDFDGIYMGWQGNAQNVVFDKIRSHRYADLQDAKGGNVGGVGKWFAPPHLFYLNYHIDGDPALFNKNLRIHDVVDAGPRIGTARDKGGTDTISGFAESIKIGGVDCSVDTYTSNRPDGFMDVLSSNGLTVSNVTATYDSAFLNNLFSGLRFPNPPYKGVTFKDILFKDAAESSVQMPISGANKETNEGIVFSNVRIEVKRWSGKGLPLPAMAGQRNEMGLIFSAAADSTRIAHSKKGGISVVLEAKPFNVSPGGTTVMTWTSTGAESCSASGAWTGELATSGARTVKVATAGENDFTLDCHGAGESSRTTLRVVAL
jgi:hypothetical protein